MGVHHLTAAPAAPRKLVLALVLAGVLGGFASTASADPMSTPQANEELLKTLRAKGILSEDDYERIIGKMRSELKAQALQEAKAADDAAKADAEKKKAEASGEKTTVGGTAFIDTTNIAQKNNGTKAASSGSGLDVKRFYIAVDHKFDDHWSANVTTDFNYVAADAETQLFIKKAFLQYKYSDALFVRAGSADMPWIPFVEGLYGYRYVENTLIDRVKFGTSADWGVHGGGSINDGLFGYALSVVNGAGYKNPTRSQSMDVEGRVSVMPIKGLTFGAGFYNGYLGKDIESTLPSVQHKADRYNFVAAYVAPEFFRVGIEYFYAHDWNQVTAVPGDTSDGYSLWGAFSFTPKISVFARYDDINPSKRLVPAYEDNYWNMGLAYAFRKNIELSLVYKHDRVEHGALATASSGTITGGNTAAGQYDEVGVWGLVKF